MTDLTITPPAAGAPQAAARCAQCTAMLAPDQLFCLSCGSRRRDARIPFRDVLATEAAPTFGAPGAAWGEGAARPPAAAGGTPPSTSYGLFLATFACLLLALGLGFWIGGNRDAPVAAAAPIVTAAVAPVATTAPVVETTPDEAAAKDDSSTDDSAAKSDSGDDAAAAAAGAAATKQLENLTPDEYQKKAAKLPAEVSTGGKELPKDDKTAGAGSEFEEIK
jgi:hypothetical protein